MPSPLVPETRRAAPLPCISVVLPLFNESAVLDHLLNAVISALSAASVRFEVIFVNDGSSDGSAELLDRMADSDSRVRVLHFSRNFGHQAAVQAGIAHSTGDAVIVMDSDMQDDPRCLTEFIRQWRDGYDVVYAVRRKRKESLLKRSLFYSFYRVLNALSDTTLPTDAGNFGLMDRRVADAVTALPENDRYFPGLRHWVGFSQRGIPVERGARHDDHPRVSFMGLVRLAKAAIFSFSSAPLAMFYVITIVSLLVCGLFSSFTLYHKFHGTATPGWTSTIIIASFFGALNALGISILGEYVVRIYSQVRGRPPFVIQRTRNFGRSMAMNSLTQSAARQSTGFPETFDSATFDAAERSEQLISFVDDELQALATGSQANVATTACPSSAPINAGSSPTDSFQYVTASASGCQLLAPNQS